jgi:NAD(P)-dependent dehydrogenase (short-subunit alcohol dehydrogenase family)
MCFKDRTVIITGGAQGIGASYARSFAAQGARLLIADLSQDAGERLAAELSDSFACEVRFVRVDVSEEAETAAMAAAAADLGHGAIDVLVNNAALYGQLQGKKPFEDITREEWDRVMAVNVRGVWNCVKSVVPYMKKRAYGKIVNIASVVFCTGAQGFAHYVASKAAVVGLTRALARELGPFGVTVNAVSPGLVTNQSTLILNTQDYVGRMAGTRALNREMAPDDLQGAVLFLASERSNFITGQNVIVDGGAVFV